MIMLVDAGLRQAGGLGQAHLQDAVEQRIGELGPVVEILE